MCQYITLREQPEWKNPAAQWFHSKWGVPTQAYLDCMDAYLGRETEYGWYLCVKDGQILGGLGVIENDFHDRKDLTPTGGTNLYIDYRMSGVGSVSCGGQAPLPQCRIEPGEKVEFTIEIKPL